MYLRGPYFRPLHGKPIDNTRPIRRATGGDQRPPMAPCAREPGRAVDLRRLGDGHGLAEDNPIIGTVKPKTRNCGRER